MLDLLHSLSRGLESWNERHSHTIALLEAVSTTAAVIVALWVSVAARRATRPQLKASVSVYQIVHRDGRPPESWPSYITVRLTNIGTVPARLHATFFAWRLRFRRSAWMALPLDAGGSDVNVGQRTYPIILPPNHTELIQLTDLATFRDELLPGILDGGRLRRRLSAMRLRAVVFTDDNSVFTVAFDQPLRKELAAFGRRVTTGARRAP